MEIHHITSAQSAKRPAQSGKRIAQLFIVSFALCAIRFALFAAVQDGYIVKVESTTLYLDWGKASGVQSGDQFKVYRAGEELKHPVTGEVLGKAETELGQGLLLNIEEKYSTAKLVETKGGIKAGDRSRHLEVTRTQNSGLSPAS